MAESPGAKPWWRSSRVLGVVLALSLAFNVFTLIGFVAAPLFMEPPSGAAIHRFERMVGRLELTPEQRVQFTQTVERLQANKRELDEANHPLEAKAWEQLTGPSPDAATLHDLLHQLSTNREHFWEVGGDAVVDFVVTLDQPKRQQVGSSILRIRDPSTAPMRHEPGN